MKRSLSRTERLTSGSDIRRVFRTGQRLRTQGMQLHFLRNLLSYTRVVVVPSKGYGNAVNRNRCRRHGKEAFRAQKEDIQPGYDLVFLCYPGEYSFAERLNQMSRLLKKAELK